jgi:Cytochrome C biogenesis protein
LLETGAVDRRFGAAARPRHQNLIRQRIAEGESNAAVRAYLASRYGDFILLKPPFEPQTWLLWLSAPCRFRPASPPSSSTVGSRAGAPV